MKKILVTLIAALFAVMSQTQSHAATVKYGIFGKISNLNGSIYGVKVGDQVYLSFQIDPTIEPFVIVPDVFASYSSPLEQAEITLFKTSLLKPYHRVKNFDIINDGNEMTVSYSKSSKEISHNLDQQFYTTLSIPNSGWQAKELNFNLVTSVAVKPANPLVPDFKLSDGEIETFNIIFKAKGFVTTFITAEITPTQIVLDNPNSI